MDSSAGLVGIFHESCLNYTPLIYILLLCGTAHAARVVVVLWQC